MGRTTEVQALGIRDRVVNGTDQFDVSDALRWRRFVNLLGCDIKDRIWNSHFHIINDDLVVFSVNAALHDNLIVVNERTRNLFFYTTDHNGCVCSRWICNDVVSGIFILDLFARAVVEMYYPWRQKLLKVLTLGRWRMKPEFQHWKLGVVRIWDSPDNYTDYVVTRSKIYNGDSALSDIEKHYGIPRHIDINLFERKDYEQRREQFDRLQSERDRREGRQEG